MTAKVFHAHLWGTRKHKYAELRESDITRTEWTELAPHPSFYLLRPQDDEREREYSALPSLVDAVPLNGTGVITKRDGLTIHFSSDELWHVVREFERLPPEQARERFNLPRDVRDWRVQWAQRDLRQTRLSRDLIEPILYRPFDMRWIYYTGNSRGFIGWPVQRVMSHMRIGPNVALVSARSNKSAVPDHFFCTRLMMETKCGESTTQSALFPLYFYGSDESLISPSDWPWSQGGRVPNLSPAFVAAMAERLRLTFVSDGVGDLGLASEDAGDTRNAAVPAAPPSGDAGGTGTFGPEDVFHYIYAVFHAPTYRARIGRGMRSS